MLKHNAFPGHAMHLDTVKAMHVTPFTLQLTFLIGGL